MRKNKKLTDSQREYLAELRIQFQHEVLDQHKVEKSPGTKPLSRKEKEEFEKYAAIKNGIYSKEEEEVIQNNWELFCKVHEWDPTLTEPFVFGKYENSYVIPRTEERRRFAQFLANGLPSRTLVSVFNKFKSMFNKTIYAKQRYTVKEDNIILKYMGNIDIDKNKYVHRNYAKLSKILGRSRCSINHRYRKLLEEKEKKPNKKSNNNLQNKVTWTMKLCNELVANLLEYTLSTNVKQLKNAVIPKVVWLELQEKMGVKSNDLESFWFTRLHLQLFSPKPIYLNDVKIQLIDKLYELKSTEEANEHRWIKMAHYFDGTTPLFLNHIFHRMATPVGKRIEEPTYEKKLDYLYNRIIPRMLKNSKDKFLRRLQYINGELRILPEDNFELKYEMDSDGSDLDEETYAVVFGHDIKKDESKTDINLTLELCSDLVTNLLDLTMSSSIKQLKNALIPQVVWQEIENRMKIKKDKLEKVWLLQLHVQLFSPKSLYLNDLKIQLIERLYELKVTDCIDVKWSKLISYFDGLTPLFLNRLFNTLSELVSKKVGNDNFEDVVEYLYTKEIPNLLKSSNDRFLKRVEYSDGKLRYISEENIQSNEIKSENTELDEDKLSITLKSEIETNSSD